MAKSQDTFNKKEKEKKRLKKRQEKNLKREDRKSNSTGGELENMLAYVDENGNLTDTPPDPSKKRKVVVVMLVIAIVFNPINPLYFGSFFWSIIDFIVAALFFNSPKPHHDS